MASCSSEGIDQLPESERDVGPLVLAEEILIVAAATASTFTPSGRFRYDLDHVLDDVGQFDEQSGDGRVLLGTGSVTRTSTFCPTTRNSALVAWS